MIQRRRSRAESDRPVGIEIELSPDIPDQREPGPTGPGRVEEDPGWRTEAWETEFVDTSYSNVVEQKPPMTLELDCLYKDVLRDLRRHLNSSKGCPTCGIEGEIYNTAKDSIKYLVNMLSENISYKNKVNALEREIDRYITQMVEYKRIAEIAQLGRNNPAEPTRDVAGTVEAANVEGEVRTTAEWLELLRAADERETRR